MIPVPAALVVAHPGHELLLHRWLELARPRVFVITDGSGAGRSRIDATLETLRATNCAAGSVLAAFTDREIYRVLLNGEVEPVLAMTLTLAESFVERGIGSVVADAFEMYNPTHDLCSVVARLAAERAEMVTGLTIARYDYAVTEAASGEGETIALDEAAFVRKLAAADRCEQLKHEVDGLIARIGVNALSREVLRPASNAVTLPLPAHTPFYETHGEKRVAAGNYATVIRYEQHFRPFVERLIAAMQAAPVTQHALRS